jgi:chromosome segregation ATPase
VKARFAEHNAAAADLQARQSEARQTLDAERARYEEIEATFNRLERELDNAGGP